MKKHLVSLIIFCLVFHSLNSQIVYNKPLSERITGYKIDASLNTVSKIVSCTMEAFWVNRSGDIVPDIRMHLYLNAFKSNKTTYYKESGGSPGTKESDYGWIAIRSLKNREGTDLIPMMQYISPDDGNAEDLTVIKIDLPKPALPGDTVFLKINFESKLPSKIIRTGYNDDFYFVAQWFPKFGVYEPAGMRYAIRGGWNCHQFHENSEFYSNHSVYDVKITLPKEYVVGSGGMLINSSDLAGGKKTLTYRAEDIVDFAWTAWPGYTIYTDQWKSVKLTLLIPEDRITQVDRQFKAVKNALEYFTENIGPYPWPYLTFVDPPGKGAGAGGMEYTTFFTSISSYIMPEFLHLPEMVTIHEFGHAYFMGILANNEFEEPWLDEGLNTFWEEIAVDHYYGNNSGLLDLPFFKISDKSLSRISYILSGSRQVVSNTQFSWKYPHNTYSMMSYNKTATWLFTLMGIVGEETTREIFREYYRKWAFRNPSGNDFKSVVNEVVKRKYGSKFGSDMNWFFDQTLNGTGLCDYKVAGFYNEKPQRSVGKIESVDSLDRIIARGDTLYNSVVQIERAGSIMLPEEVLVHFESGEEVLESWDGKSRYKDFAYTGNRKIKWVKIDPEYKITMDINYINNSLTSDPDKIPVRRITNKLISFMQFFINFISL